MNPPGLLQRAPGHINPLSPWRPFAKPPLPVGEGWGEGKSTTPFLVVPGDTRYPWWGSGTRRGYTPPIASCRTPITVPHSTNSPRSEAEGSRNGPGAVRGYNLTHHFAPNRRSPTPVVPSIVSPHSDAGPVPTVGRGTGAGTHSTTVEHWPPGPGSLSDSPHLTGDAGCGTELWIFSGDRHPVPGLQGPALSQPPTHATNGQHTTERYVLRMRRSSAAARLAP